MCRPGVPLQDAVNGGRSTTKLRPARLQFGVKGQTNKKDLKQDECEGLMCPLTFAHTPRHICALHAHATTRIRPYIHTPWHVHVLTHTPWHIHALTHTPRHVHAPHTHTHAMARICPYTQTHQEINILKARRASCSVFPFQKNKK